MCVCEKVCVCVWGREISRVNYSPEHVETHLSYNGKLQHRRRKDRRKKGRLTKKERWTTQRERLKSVGGFFALKTHIHTRTLAQRTSFSSRLVCCGARVQGITVAFTLEDLFNKIEDVFIFKCMFLLLFLQSVFEEVGLGDDQVKLNIWGKKSRV